MEDPFSVLQSLVLEPPTPPNLVPVLPTFMPHDVALADDGDQTPQPSSSIGDELRLVSTAAPVAVPPDTLSTLFPSSTSFYPVPAGYLKKSLRHWKVYRNLPRNRPRDLQDGIESSPVQPPWKRRRLAVTTDYGVYSTLLGKIAAENAVRFDDFPRFMGKDDEVLERIKRTLQPEEVLRHVPKRLSEEDGGLKDDQMHSKNELSSSESYVHDIVYGGVEGFAYVRSVAEFVANTSRRLEVSQLSSVVGDVTQQ